MSINYYGNKSSGSTFVQPMKALYLPDHRLEMGLNTNYNFIPVTRDTGGRYFVISSYSSGNGPVTITLKNVANSTIATVTSTALIAGSTFAPSYHLSSSGGCLYGLINTGTANRLFKIDDTTGTATLIGAGNFTSMTGTAVNARHCYASGNNIVFQHLGKRWSVDKTSGLLVEDNVSISIASINRDVSYISANSLLGVSGIIQSPNLSSIAVNNYVTNVEFDFLALSNGPSLFNRCSVMSKDVIGYTKGVLLSASNIRVSLCDSISTIDDDKLSLLVLSTSNGNPVVPNQTYPRSEFDRVLSEIFTFAEGIPV